MKQGQDGCLIWRLAEKMKHVTETEYNETQSKEDRGASVHFTEYTCVRKTKWDEYELLV